MRSKFIRSDNIRPVYSTLPPLRQELYREFVSRHGCEPTTLAELDDVAEVLYTAGVQLASLCEEDPHA